jgi:hypothetical protein
MIGPVRRYSKQVLKLTSRNVLQPDDMGQWVASCSMLIVNLHDHREIIVGGFGWDRKVKAEERRVKPETWPSRATGPEELSGRAPRWMVLTAALTLAGVIGLIAYGYVARPGWIGVSGKKFWDYLELLIVPAALGIGVYWLNRRQTERDNQAEAERERERKAL